MSDKTTHDKRIKHTRTTQHNTTQHNSRHSTTQDKGIVNIAAEEGEFGNNMPDTAKCFVFLAGSGKKYTYSALIPHLTRFKRLELVVSATFFCRIRLLGDPILTAFWTPHTFFFCRVQGTSCRMHVVFCRMLHLSRKF